jgi:hypothetical protein
MTATLVYHGQVKIGIVFKKTLTGKAMGKFNACWKVIFIFKLKSRQLYELQVEYFYDQSEKSRLSVLYCLTRPPVLLVSYLGLRILHYYVCNLACVVVTINYEDKIALSQKINE